MPNRIQNFLLGKLFGIKQEVPKQKSPSTFLPMTSMSAFSGSEYPIAGSATAVKYYSSWVYAAIDTRAQEFAKMDLRLYQQDAKGNVTEADENNDAWALLRMVNNRSTLYDLLYMKSVYQDTYGEAFWWLVRDGNKIIAIYPWLNPSQMIVKVNTDGTTNHYEYRVEGKSDIISFDVKDIIHFKHFNPKNAMRGLSLIMQAAYAVATDNEAAKYNWIFFKNNAKPAGVITYPFTLTDIQIQQAKAQWDREHKGNDNAHQITILGDDAKYVDSGITQKDMDFLEGRKFNRDEILSVFKVPLAILNPNESINRATVDAANAFFFERVIEPLMIQFVNTINEFLLPNFDTTGKFFFDFLNKAPRNRADDIAYYQSGINNGWLTQNEARELEGLKPVPEGNTLYLPFNITSAGIVPDDANQNSKILKQLHIHAKPSLAQRVYGESKKLATKIIEERKARIKTKDQVKQESKQDDRWTDNRRHIGEGFVAIAKARFNNELKNFKKKLIDEFGTQEARVLKTVRQKSIQLKDIDFKFDVDAEADLFAEIFLPIVKDIVAAHGEDALRLLGKRGFNVNAAVQRYLKTDGLKFSKTIQQTTKDKINAQIAEGLKGGEGLDKIRGRIQNVFTECKTSRAKTIAQTETVAASNFGIEEGYKQSDVVEQKEWYTPLDEDLDVCVPMDGTTVEVGQKFDLPDGDSVDAPPAHPNCHCTILPVVSGKSIQLVTPVIVEQHVIDEQATAEVQKVLDEGKEAVKGLKDIQNKLQDSIEEDKRDGEIKSLTSA